MLTTFFTCITLYFYKSRRCFYHAHYSLYMYYIIFLHVLDYIFICLEVIFSMLTTFCTSITLYFYMSRRHFLTMLIASRFGPSPGDILAFKAHAATGAMLIQMACASTWSHGDIRAQAGYWGSYLGLWFCCSQSLCWCLWPVLLPKATWMPEFWATICGHFDVQGLCCHQDHTNVSVLHCHSGPCWHQGPSCLVLCPYN